MITTTTMTTIMTMIIINGTVAEIYQNMFLKDLQQNKKKAKKKHWNLFPIVQAVDTSLVTYKYGKKARYKEKGGECVTGDDDGFLWNR